MTGIASLQREDEAVTLAADRDTADEKPSPKAQKGSPAPRADRKKRQNALLDEGLKETFPASDPVSVVRIT